jgi:hypothetical protein
MKLLSKTMSGSRARVCATALTALAASSLQAPAHVKPEPKGEERVQIAILLDTSGSMSGLIEQAKTQLWKIVNTFVEAERGGKTPYVEVALYQYGNSSLPSGEHWIQMICPLTRDLDGLSEKLFSLTTSGGEEYCGAVIQRAVNELEWDPRHDVYKAIFIAGNEPFTQGPIDPTKSCRHASGHGIFVNTIHCGGEQAGISGGWKAGSTVADGTFLNINHNKHVVHVEAPQDSKILELNIKLNSTYVPYGREGAKKLSEQAAQDANAERQNSAVGRAYTKSTGNYYNGTWDLVDASRDKDFNWADVKKDDLPAPMAELSPKERQDYVEEQRRKRVEIQNEIRGLNEAREAHVAKVQAESGDTEGDTLGKAVESAVRAQAGARGYSFKK